LKSKLLLCVIVTVVIGSGTPGAVGIMFDSDEEVVFLGRSKDNSESSEQILVTFF